jgi:hypothetical protein
MYQAYKPLQFQISPRRRAQKAKHLTPSERNRARRPLAGQVGPNLEPVGIHDSFGKRLRSFLRQIVSHAARDRTLRIFAGEFSRISTGIRVWGAIGVAFHGDGRHGDHGTLRQSLFQVVILRFTFRQAQPPTVVVDDDCNMIRIVEGRCAALERGIAELPFRRSQLPNQFRKIVPVFIVAGAPAFRGKVILVPPEKFGLGDNGIFPDSWLPIR